LFAVAGVLAVDSDYAVADVFAVTGIHDLVLVHALAGTHAIADVSSVVGPTVTGFYALALINAVAGVFFCFWLMCYSCWHPSCFRFFSSVVGPTVAGILASCCSFSSIASAVKFLQSLEGDLLHFPMPERTGSWIEIRSCYWNQTFRA
jgi:hypothetical protein